MKKSLIFASILLMIVLAVAVKSASQAMIYPLTPSDTDTLTCAATESGEFDFIWMQNGQEFKTDFGSTSVVSAGDTLSGDNWKCVIKTPFGNIIGEAEVNIDVPETNGNAIITPSNPDTTQAITCTATSAGEFDFIWTNNDVEFKTDFGSFSTISASDTTAGDNWKCTIKTPFGNTIGEDSVLIDSNPFADVSITPDYPRTADDLTASTDSGESYNYRWFKDGEEFRSDYGTDSVIDDSETTKNDLWTVRAYTPLYNKLVGEYSTYIYNTAPQIINVNAPLTVQSEEPFTITFSATDADNDSVYYFVLRENRIVSDTNRYVGTETDGAIDYHLVATDLEDVTYYNITITVEGYEREIRIYDLDIASVTMPEGNYLKIRNSAHSVNDVALRISEVDSSSVQTENLNLERNVVRMIPLKMSFEQGKNYLLKIDVVSDEFTGSDYIIVQA